MENIGSRIEAIQGAMIQGFNDVRNQIFNSEGEIREQDSSDHGSKDSRIQSINYSRNQRFNSEGKIRKRD